MKLTIENTFHNTSASVVVSTESMTMSARSIKRADNKLCGMSDCSCGGIFSRFISIKDSEDRVYVFADGQFFLSDEL